MYCGRNDINAGILDYGEDHCLVGLWLKSWNRRGRYVSSCWPYVAPGLLVYSDDDVL